LSATLLDLLRWGACALLGVALLSTILAAYHYAKSRRAKYYASRQGALDRFKRWRLATVVLILLAVLLYSLSQLPARGSVTVNPG
jgi:hypothetical protein